MAKTVLYASTDVSIRSSAAGSYIRGLEPNSLMIYDSSDAPVKKEYNEKMYTWIKVKYFYNSAGSPVVDASDTGWVARENTEAVDLERPTKSSVVKGNRFLTQVEMLINARYIFNYLYNQSGSDKWSATAILGALGNMEAESTINPGRWQNGIIDEKNSGYGLAQWTSPKKYFDWLPSGASRDDIDNQLDFLIHEVQTEDYWNSSGHSPAITFKDYIHNNKMSVQECAEYFLKCYEQPEDSSAKVVAQRAGAALKWSTIRNAMAGKF